ENKINKMSTRFMIALIMKLLSILFSAALICSNQSMVPLKSFKINDNVTYDCIDIYKQPGLDHPLLRNHTIQMQPSVSRHEIKKKIGNNKTFKKMKCPYGTVPVLRNTKEFISSAQLFVNNSHLISADSPGTHIAGIRSHNGSFRGIEAWFNGINLNVGKDQASYSQIYISGGLYKDANFISAGWMINPALFGDGRVWTYGFWKGKGGKGCYNTACSGFVQVSHYVPISEPIDLKPGKFEWMLCSIHQDKQTGNWWLSKIAPDEDVGYWPKELFDQLENGANMIGAGGVVQASHSGSSPPMGMGNFPNRIPSESAIFAKIEVLSSNFEKCKINHFPIEKLVDSAKCYGLRIGKNISYSTSELGFFFNYGSPGGNSCGI
ncbi:unnamed protein product, partial [Thlaspi arvense]